MLRLSTTAVAGLTRKLSILWVSGAAEVLLCIVPGEHEHGQVLIARRGSVTEATNKLIARHLGHFDVANREIEALGRLGQHTQCIRPIARGPDRAHTDVGQRCLQYQRRKGFILHNQDGQGIQFLLGHAPLLIASLCPLQNHTTL